MTNYLAQVDPKRLEGMELIDVLTKNYNSAKTIGDLWISLLQACYFYAVPWRNRFYIPNNSFQGDMKNQRVYDTTAVEATKTFVSKLQETMTPPGVQWGFLRVEEGRVPFDEDISGDAIQVNSIQEAQQIVDAYMTKLFTYIHRSNFDVVINECYYDLAIGTASLVINQGTDENPIMCTSIPMDKLSIKESANSKIEYWYRTWDDLKVNELQMRWPGIQITPTMQMDLAENRDATVRTLYEGTTYFADVPKTPYCYAVWVDGERPLLVQWLENNPGIIWRFQKTNNETWGRGPVMDALPSIISLNEMARLELAAANLNVFRPFMGFSDAVFNPHTFTLEPFSIIPIAPVGAGGTFPLTPLPGSSDAQFTQMTVQDLRVQILKLLYAETPMTNQSVQPQTAYALSLKQQELAEKIGPMFSRLLQEFLEPVIIRVAHILHTTGILPSPKFSFKNFKLVFKYKSPLDLAEGQKGVSRLVQYVQVMQGIFGPQAAILYINPATAPYMIADALQIDPDYLNKAEDVARVMQEQQNQQQIQQLQAEQQGGQQQPQQAPQQQ